MAKKAGKFRMEKALEHRILKGLMVEWDMLTCSYLPRHQYEIFRPPLFSLKPFKRQFGQWDPQKREISINRDFALNHPWDSIIDVLRHEIAHQYTHEMLHAHNETSHGAAFQKACQILRANPKASGTYKSLHERLQRNSLGEKDKILVRVKKLMALAESQNQNEAEAAMLKAYELIEKYNIDMIERLEQRQFVSIFIGKPALRHFREEYALGSLIQRHYFVQGIWTRIYILEKEKKGSVLEITGTAQNVQMAAYVFDFVTHFIDSQWAVYNKDKKLNRYRKTDFAIGIISGFESKLENRQKKPAADVSSQKALIALDDPQLDQHMSYLYPRISKIRQKSLAVNKEVIDDGVSIGKKLVISKGVTNTGEKGKYLPN